MLTLSNIANMFFAPVACPRPASGYTRDHGRAWVNNEGKNSNVAAKTNFGTYGSGALSLLGLVGFFFGKKTQNSILEWTGVVVGVLGAIGAAVGKIFGVEYDIIDAVTNKVLLSPYRKVTVTPEDLSLPCEKVEIPSGDGVLKGYFIPAKNKTNKTILYLHGRNQNNGDCLPTCKTLMESTDANVLVVDYRGFGYSSGTPSPKGVVEDANKMYEYLLKKQNLTSDDITIFGHSLGGGIGIKMASELKARGIIVPKMIIQSSFTSPAAVVQDYSENVLPSFDPKYLVGDTFNSLESLKTLDKSTELVFAHGTNDWVISHEQSKLLHEEAQRLGMKSSYHTLKDGTHSSFTDFIFTDAEYKAAIQPPSTKDRPPVPLQIYNGHNDHTHSDREGSVKLAA